MGRATSGATSSPHARSASSRPRPTGSSPASTPCPATIRSSFPCRSEDAFGASPALAQCPQIRKLLLHASDIAPGILLEAAETLAQIEHGVLVAAFGAAELLPRHRHRHRRTRAGARRIGDR